MDLDNTLKKEDRSGNALKEQIKFVEELLRQTRDTIALGLCFFNQFDFSFLLFQSMYWILDNEKSKSNPSILNLSSDMNGSNFKSSSLLCNRGNTPFSKERSALSSRFQPSIPNDLKTSRKWLSSKCVFNGISEHAIFVRHAYHLTACLLDAWLSRTLTTKR